MRDGEDCGVGAEGDRHECLLFENSFFRTGKLQRRNNARSAEGCICVHSTNYSEVKAAIHGGGVT